MNYSILVMCLLLQALITDCCETRNDDLPGGIIFDSITVYKSQRRMDVFLGHRKIKEYRIALGKNPVGKKQFEGDYKTPEGLYSINDKNAGSKYHKNLNISYPNQTDLLYAKKCGKSSGGDIKIHGLPEGCNEKNYRRSDWTWGCIGLTNSEIDEVYNHTKLGTPILLLP